MLTASHSQVVDLTLAQLVDRGTTPAKSVTASSLPSCRGKMPASSSYVPRHVWYCGIFSHAANKQAISLTLMQA
jgi:hypothetical protein